MRPCCSKKSTSWLRLGNSLMDQCTFQFEAIGLSHILYCSQPQGGTPLAFPVPPTAGCMIFLSMSPVLKTMYWQHRKAMESPDRFVQKGATCSAPELPAFSNCTSNSGDAKRKGFRSRKFLSCATPSVVCPGQKTGKQWQAMASNGKFESEIMQASWPQVL